MKITDALDRIRELAEQEDSQSAQEIAALVNQVYPRWSDVDLFKMSHEQQSHFLALLEREKKLVPFLKERHPKYVDEDGHARSINLADDLGFFGPPEDLG